MATEILRNPHLEGDTFFWQGGPVGALLLHGYTATTAEVRLLGRALRERGYTVSGPLLPGHKTTPEDMNRCRWQDWAAAVEQAYHQLAARCERVFIGGESMGAVLTLYAASQPFASQAAGLLLYAPALLVPGSRMWLARLLAPFVAAVNKGEGAPSAADARWQGYPNNPLRAAVQLNDLQRETRRCLPQVRQPLLVVQGRLDTTIDPRSGQVILSESASSLQELHWLERSTHCIILDQEWEQAADLALRFMARALAPLP
jgi:carboxylesterase